MSTTDMEIVLDLPPLHHLITSKACRLKIAGHEDTSIRKGTHTEILGSFNDCYMLHSDGSAVMFDLSLEGLETSGKHLLARLGAILCFKSKSWIWDRNV